MLFSLFRVSGNSMVPSFRAGQLLFASSFSYFFREPKKGDVVIIKDPRDGKPLLKRIIKREKGKFFVAGDNSKASTDSRTFGSVMTRHIMGKVIFKLDL